MVNLDFAAFGRRSTLYRSRVDVVFTRAASHNQIKSFSLWAKNSLGAEEVCYSGYVNTDLTTYLSTQELNVAICASAAALHQLYLSEASSLKQVLFRVELHGNS